VPPPSPIALPESADTPSRPVDALLRPLDHDARDFVFAEETPSTTQTAVFYYTFGDGSTSFQPIIHLWLAGYCPTGEENC